MKKSILIALAAFTAGSIFAQESNTVSSANIVGYVKSVQQDGLQIITSPFGGGTLNEIAPTNGLGGTTLSTADNVYLYVPGEGYKNYFLAGDVGNPEYNYKWFDNETGTLATNVIPAGQSFWYRSRVGTTNEVVFSGNVVLDNSITNQIVEGLQLISSPYSASLDLNSLGLTNGLGGTTLSSADNIHLYVPGEGYKNYFLAGDVGNPEYNYKWFDNETGTLATNKISMETGFWYRCRKTGGFTWVMPRPYLND